MILRAKFTILLRRTDEKRSADKIDRIWYRSIGGSCTV